MRSRAAPARSRLGGAAVYPRFPNAVTNISGCNFHDNEAVNTAGGGLGGAILLWDGAPLTISRSTFTANIARTSGGAIFGQGPSTVNASDCQFLRNRVTDTFAEGGAIHAQGTATIQRCAFTENSASRGGAIHVPSGTTTVSASTFETNWSAYGGAARVMGGTLSLSEVTMNRNGYTATGIQVNTGGGAISQGGGTITANNVTISNSWASYGAALDRDGGTPGAATFTNVTISGGGSVGSGAIDIGSGTLNTTNVTITNNQASFFAGGVTVRGGTYTLRNTIVAKNVGRPNLERIGAGVITSAGFNLCDDTSGAGILTNTGDKSGTQFDPLLSPLANNGGKTQTHLPGAGSPAIDNATTSGAPARDQRGYLRAGGGSGHWRGGSERHASGDISQHLDPRAC